MVLVHLSKTAICISYPTRQRTCQKRPSQSTPLHQPRCNFPGVGDAALRALLRGRLAREPECASAERKQGFGMGQARRGEDIYHWRCGEFSHPFAFRDVCLVERESMADNLAGFLGLTISYSWWHKITA